MPPLVSNFTVSVRGMTFTVAWTPLPSVSLPLTVNEPVCAYWDDGTLFHVTGTRLDAPSLHFTVTVDGSLGAVPCGHGNRADYAGDFPCLWQRSLAMWVLTLFQIVRWNSPDIAVS